MKNNETKILQTSKHYLKIIIFFMVLTSHPSNSEIIVSIGSGYGWKIGKTEVPEPPSPMSISEILEYVSLLGDSSNINTLSFPRQTSHSLGNGLKSEVSIKYFFPSNFGIVLSGGISTFGGWEKTHADKYFEGVKSNYFAINVGIIYRFSNVYFAICPGLYFPNRYDSLYTFHNSVTDSSNSFYDDLIIVDKTIINYKYELGYGAKSFVGYNYNVNKRLALSAELFIDLAVTKIKEQNEYIITSDNKFVSTGNFTYCDEVANHTRFDYLFIKPKATFYSAGTSLRISWSF